MWKRLGGVLASAGLIVLATAGSSSAAGNGSGWHRYKQADFTVPAGKACAFEVAGTVVRDGEYYKNVSFFPDGKPRLQKFKGPLVMDYTNTSTGKHIRENLSGRAVETLTHDGDFSSIVVRSGHFGATVGAGSNIAMGLYRIGGRWSSLTAEPDGTETVTLGARGTAEPLCARLAG